MIWTVGVLYLLGGGATWWLTGHVEAFVLVCVDDRGAMSVAWPFTWLAAFCVALLQGTAMLHERIVPRDPD